MPPGVVHHGAECATLCSLKWKSTGYLYYELFISTIVSSLQHCAHQVTKNRTIILSIKATALDHLRARHFLLPRYCCSSTTGIGMHIQHMTVDSSQFCCFREVSSEPSNRYDVKPLPFHENFKTFQYFIG